MPDANKDNIGNDSINELDNRIRGLLHILDSPESTRPSLQPYVATSPPRDWVAIAGLFVTILAASVTTYVSIKITIAENVLNIASIQGDLAKYSIYVDKEFTQTNAKIVRHEVMIDKAIEDLKLDADRKITATQNQISKLIEEIKTIDTTIILQNERINNLRGK